MQSKDPSFFFSAPAIDPSTEDHNDSLAAGSSALLESSLLFERGVGLYIALQVRGKHKRGGEDYTVDHLCEPLAGEDILVEKSQL